MNNEWEYYNHALVPTLPPHIDPDISWMKDSDRWKEYAGGKMPLFARWVSNFDCTEETEWWCIIKDTPFDIMSLKSNRRSLITRGLKRVDVKVIIPADYAEQMSNILVKEWKYYDDSYEEGNDRQKLTDDFKKLTMKNLGNAEYLGAFLKDTDTMIGYASYNLFDDWIEYSVVKTDPEYLNTQVNAALAYFGVERYMRPGIKYIHGGWRTVIHESNYQEYPAIFKEFVEILGPDIATIHAKDFKIENGKLLSCACGTGQMDYEFLLRYIKEHKPHIHVLLEDTNPSNAQQARQFMEEKYASL